MSFGCSDQVYESHKCCCSHVETLRKQTRVEIEIEYDDYDCGCIDAPGCKWADLMELVVYESLTQKSDGSILTLCARTALCGGLNSTQAVTE
jgi:hypothetical protein